MSSEEKERQINPRSLENLKLGAEARRKGKIRRNTTLLPETIEWLEERGNVSEMIDQLVASAKNGLSSDAHKSTNENLENNSVSNDVYESIRVEVEQLRSQVASLKEELERSQSKQKLPDLEVVRDRVLLSLKLGKQAPEYKRVQKVIERFIGELRRVQDEALRV